MEAVKLSVEEFKQRVTKEWGGEDAAAAWQKHYPAMREQFANVTQAIVDAANPQPGENVLDLAAGTGEPSLPIAKRVAPNGKVTATDFSSEMVDMVAANAKAQGIENIETKTADAHELPFGDASFDLVTSRFGVMFFAEIDKALGEIRRVVKPGGRVAFMVWGAPEPDTYFGMCAMPIMKRLAVKPDPDGPGPMRFMEPGKLVKLVEAAGFQNVQETSHKLPAPFKGSPEELLTATMEIAAPFRTAAASLSDEERSAAIDETLGNLQTAYDGTHCNLIAPVMIVTASRGS